MTFGLALSGGGIRGAVHIGILQGLMENNLYPDLISGSSAGSLIGLLYCSGIAPLNMASLVTEHSAQLLKIPAGLIKGDYIESAIKKITQGKTFDQLSPNLAVVTTDINTGKGIVFTNKKLAQTSGIEDYIFSNQAFPWEAVRASIAIPGIFYPKKISKRTLVDGSLVSHVPVDVLKYLGADKIVGINLAFGGSSSKTATAPELIMQTINIMGYRLSKLILKIYANIIIEPETGKVNFWEVNKTREMINIGKKAIYDNLTVLKELLV